MPVKEESSADNKNRLWARARSLKKRPLDGWKRKDFELEARLPFNRLQTLIFGFLFFSTDAEITFVFLADE